MTIDELQKDLSKRMQSHTLADIVRASGLSEVTCRKVRECQNVKTDTIKKVEEALTALE